MADNDFMITISGAALSLLFYENVRSCGDQMGFLLGETLEFVVKTYTDSDNQVETVKIHNNIETIVTCPLPEILHDSLGRINKEKLKDFLRDNSKQVIGWFRFRRSTGLVPTMRDKTLHKEFASHFSGANGSKEEFFVTCLLNSSLSSERGTHKFKHVFLRRRRGIFEPVPVKINNLGKNSLVQDGSEYKPTPNRKSSDIPDVFSTFVESLNLNLTRTSGLETAIAIQKAAEQYLNQLIPEVCESDLEVAQLEKKVKEFKQRKMAKMNGGSNNVNQNNDTEKNRVCEKVRKAENISPSRIESPENVCAGDGRTFKDHSTTSSQTNTIYKQKNTTLHIEKNINQNKTKRLSIDTMNSPSQEPPPTNSVAETKVDVTKTATNRNQRVSMESQIVKMSICKNEPKEIGVGRGRGRLINESLPGLKKARTTSGPIATRSNSERTSHTPVSQLEASEENSVLNTYPKELYNQIAKKKVDNARKSDTADTH